MTYFLPSFFQKRLLRYALSRLELLETDDLALDKLNIAWGRRSTVELRDVGLRLKTDSSTLQKLSSLLNLPPNLSLLKARISLLRLTIPADLYKSSIIVEVVGVEVLLKTKAAEKEERGNPQSKLVAGQDDRHSKDVKIDQPRSIQPLVHDPGGLRSSQASDMDEDDTDSSLPTTDDLAQSFLQAEPQAEKEGLKAAIAESYTLEESSIASEPEDEASAYGVGNALSLPTFLADFLRGVGDRVQVKIEHVTVDLEANLDLPLGSSAGSTTSDKSEIVTIRLSIEGIDLKGAAPSGTAPYQDSDHSPPKKDVHDELSSPITQHTRQIKLRNIQGMLVSDALLFASLSRFDVPSSPTNTQTSSIPQSGSKPRANISRLALSTSSTSQRTMESMEIQDNHQNTSVSSALEASAITSDSERFADAENDLVEALAPPNASDFEGSRYQDSILADSFYSNDGDQKLDYMYKNNSISSDPSPKSRSIPQDLRHHFSAGRHEEQISSFTADSIDSQNADILSPSFYSSSIGDLRFSQDPPEDIWKSNSVSRRITDNEYEPSVSYGESRSIARAVSGDIVSEFPISEDLTQSKIFSHEEAESMYMSAISHASTDDEKPSVALDGLEPSRLESPSSPAEDPKRLNRGSSYMVENPSSGLGFGEYQPTTSERSPTPKPSLPHTTSPDSLKNSMEQHYTVFSGNEERPGIRSSRGSEDSSGRSENPHLMIKNFISIDYITLELPREKSNSTKQLVRNLESEPIRNHTYFSAASNDLSGFDAAETAIYHNEPSSTSRDSACKPLEQNPLKLEKVEDLHQQQKLVQIGRMELFGDIGLIKLTALAIQQNLAPPEPRTGKKEDSEVIDTLFTDLRLKVDNISWKFLDLVREYAPSRSNDENPLMSGERSFPNSTEVLLKTTVDLLDLRFRRDASLTSTKLSVGRFSFGYVSEDIISFDSGLKMRESTRDVLTPIDDDLVLTMTQTRDSSKLHLTTQPLRLCLDLRRLDETFSWFGGFSSILGLGSSMMSTVTVVNAKPRPSQTPKPRGVHFEASTLASASNTNNHHTQKLTIRIGSIAVILQGANCALRIDSTAMKFVSRAEGIGLQVDKLKFAGPFLNHEIGEPSITAEIVNIRMEYLSTPKEVDLARLLALLSPSKDQYGQDDDILLDTLLRQRRQGGVLRVTVETCEGHVSNIDQFQLLPDMAEELKKLSKVAKYLPEDDRPGILILGLVRNIRFEINMNANIGIIKFESENLEIAHVTLPSLTAVGIRSLTVDRNEKEELLGEAMLNSRPQVTGTPMIMARFIGNEMEPTVKVKVQNLRVEYHVSTIMALMGISDDANAEAVVSGMVSSIATITRPQQINTSMSRLRNHTSTSIHKGSTRSKLMKVHITIRDSIIGLNPRNSLARGLIVLSIAQLEGVLPKDDEASATFEIKKASLMVIDNHQNIVVKGKSARQETQNNSIDQIQDILDSGFVSVSYISSARASLSLVGSDSDGGRSLDIEIRDDLFVLESCADSTQTLQSILNGLKPPMPPSTDLKYRTEVVSVEDMLASFSGDAFAAPERRERDGYDPAIGIEEGDMVDDEVPQNLEFISSFYNPDPESFHEGIADSMLDDDLESLAGPPIIREIGDKILLESFQEQYQIAPGGAPLVFQDDHFGKNSTIGGTAHRWDTKQNTYELTNDIKIRKSPLRLRVRDAHIIWNLFDGYDWQNTRDRISKAVMEVESKAAERLSRQDRRKSLEIEEEEESEIGDFLFNSIYIGVPANRDPRDLARQVNRNLDDLASETDSYATSSASGSPSRQSHTARSKGKKLRLTRSKYHKMTFELKGVSADLVVFPPDTEETQSSIDIRVQDLDIFDHIPTSTWKKFATYMHDAGERESGTSMIHIEILNVKPVPNLAASEIILKASILPLRLHVDQDALDFMTRFFEFKDDMTSFQTPASEAAFLQRVEINSVRLKLDFKPKRVDYAGLRSGRTNEFMNFFILDRADMVLRHVIIYGISGFDKLGKTLNDIWMPDIKQNQLPGVLAGLAPVRSLVNVGGGVRDLVVVPIREYRKDGRVVRSFQKGALAFAKTTTSELVKLGAKLAIGTQTVLQGAEEFLSHPGHQRFDVSAGWEETELEDDEKKRISLYADQPVGVIQGLRGAYASLERDLLTARGAIVAMPGEIMESGTAGGAARAVLRGAPTVILRPAMGVSKAVGQTLMGATNSLDPGNRRRIEDKYKRH